MFGSEWICGNTKGVATIQSIGVQVMESKEVRGLIPTFIKLL